MKPVSIQSVILLLSLSVSLINTVPSLPSSSWGYFILILVPAKGRGSCDHGLGVHLWEGGFVWEGLWGRGPLGALGFEELPLEAPCCALPKHSWGAFLGFPVL